MRLGVCMHSSEMCARSARRGFCMVVVLRLPGLPPCAGRLWLAALVIGSLVTWPYSPLSDDFYRTDGIAPNVSAASRSAPAPFVEAWDAQAQERCPSRWRAVRANDRRHAMAAFRADIGPRPSPTIPTLRPNTSAAERRRASAAGRRSVVWGWMLRASSWSCGERGAGQYSGGGGPKRLCGFESVASRPCVAYSFGCNGDVRFERTLLAAHPNCALHLFDPSMRPLYDRLFRPRRSVPPFSAWYPRLRGAAFHSVGLGNTSGTERIADGDGWGAAGRGEVAARVETLPRIMRRLGHAWLDVLKIDAEGAEWAALESLFRPDSRGDSVARPPPIGHLLVEFHLTPSLARGRTAADALALHRRLVRAGYRLAHGDILPSDRSQCCDMAELSYVHRRWLAQPCDAGGQGALHTDT